MNILFKIDVILIYFYVHEKWIQIKLNCSWINEDYGFIKLKYYQLNLTLVYQFNGFFYMLITFSKSKKSIIYVRKKINLQYFVN